MSTVPQADMLVVKVDGQKGFGIKGAELKGLGITVESRFKVRPTWDCI